MESLTIETLLDAMAKIPKEPIGEWMREQGHPPEEWNLILPEHMKPDPVPALLPKYLGFSKFVKEAVFLYRIDQAFPFRNSMGQW